MYANTVASRDAVNIRTNSFHSAGDFVPERHRQIVDLRNARTIMSVRMANPGRLNSNQNIRRTDLGNCNVCILKRLPDLHESYSSHSSSATLLKQCALAINE